MDIQDVLTKALTPVQKDAANDNSREVLCLACAGSGKSRTLAFRIARLLSSGEPPESIVAFTFTVKAADSIKRRVSQALQATEIDPTIMGRMYIGTIHSYCQQILGDMNPINRQFDVLDNNRLKLYLISRFYDLGLQRLQILHSNSKYFRTVNEVCDAWNTANDELLDLELIKDEDEVLGSLLLNLRDSLEENQFIDYSLMIRNALEALQEGESNALRAIENLRHLMVDEYQDINPCQEKLINLMHEHSNTLFVVGDDDQSIYAWRGADVSNILNFEKLHKGCGVHTLSKNFRSTKSIVEASDQFITANLGPSRITKQPTARYNKNPQDFKVLWFEDQIAEARWVAKRIQTLLGTSYKESDGTVRGLTPADFGILMRSTRGSSLPRRHEAFTGILSEMEIPYSLEAGGGPFSLPHVEILRSTFELLRDQSPDRATVQSHFDDKVFPTFPNASFERMVRVLTEWGADIHRPKASTRIRIYPQKLVFELLEAFGISRSNFTDIEMREIGLFSKMILDVETVYMSVDSKSRFSQVLNFLKHVAESGYDVSTDDLIQRPDAVTIATVHKMKGLEFPCVFVVDAEHQRFPANRRRYSGWLPDSSLAEALERGAYQYTPQEESRLFYTAITRAERFLYVTGSKLLPGKVREWKQSPYALSLLDHPSVSDEKNKIPKGLKSRTQKRRIMDTDFPTSYSEIRYYLQCPKAYQFRRRYGFNPVVPELFGYGKTVHTSIQKIHELNPLGPPSDEEAKTIVEETFHLKHVPQSGDPVIRPGAYENSRNRAIEIVNNYVKSYAADFRSERIIEASFEIPASNCLISGSIDLLLNEDESGEIVGAEIVDFKTMEGGEEALRSENLEWTELSLQVQLYVRAADQIYGENAKTGSVHLLKDNQRINIDISQEAVEAAIKNVEWAVNGILAGDYPMRPHLDKCEKCDFKMLCPKIPQEFKTSETPPPIRLPEGEEMAGSFSQYEKSE